MIKQWQVLIDEAVKTDDSTLSNLRITRAHHLLSQALLFAVGPAAGSNFHSWAVWGSRKAGVTIRQEDKDQASRDGTVVAAVVGFVTGLFVGYLSHSLFAWPLLLSMIGWSLTGAIVGGYCGYLLAGYTRSRASSLILRGNRIVLEDIGLVSAGYLSYVESSSKKSPSEADEAFAAFIDSLRAGSTENGGQDLLKRAFRQYEIARRSDDVKVKHEANYFANCLAVYHEHIRLQPIIRDAMPLLISKCVTQRLMTYSVGQRQLAVHEDVPPLGDTPFPETLLDIQSSELEEFLHGPDGFDTGQNRLQNTKTSDWRILRQRMGYIVNLFRTQHLSAEVVASPYDELQFQAIAAGNLPSRPW